MSVPAGRENRQMDSLPTVNWISNAMEIKVQKWCRDPTGALKNLFKLNFLPLGAIHKMHVKRPECWVCFLFLCSHSLVISCQPTVSTANRVSAISQAVIRVEWKSFYCLWRKNVLHYLRERKKASDSVIYHIERPACPKNFKQRLILSD